MQMKDDLPGTLPVVDVDSEGVVGQALLARDLASDEEEVPQQDTVLNVGVAEPRDVSLGDDDYMQGRLRVDVPKGQAVLILVDDIRRDLAAKDLAEDRIVVLVSIWVLVAIGI